MTEQIAGDVRYALRTLAKAPAFAAAVIATIALAVGATATVFAVVDHILLRPLPFEGSERTVAFCETTPATARFCVASPMNVADWAASTPSLENAGVARTEAFIAQSETGNYSPMGGIVTPGFFAVLRVKPLLGRLIQAGDLPRGSNHVVVVSQEFWQQRLGGNPAVIGQSITLDRAPYTIVGVLPAGAWMPDPYADVQVWKPLTASIDDVENRRWRGFTAIGRRTPGTSPGKLIADLDVVRAQLAAAYPEANKDWGLRLVDLREQTVADTSVTLWIFLGTAGFVLLIACANVAGLLLVRATGRAAEFAVRASLGAGRGRLVQQLITESVVLSMIGGACGLLLAVWLTAAFVGLAPPDIPRLAEVAVDGRVALFAFALATVVAIFFGVAPARGAWKTDLNGALKGVRGGQAADTRLRSAFTIAQLALALMLLFGAGLLTRSFARWAQWDAGFDRANVVYTWMLPPRLDTAAGTVALMERVREEVAQVPGVQFAALGSAGPLFGGTESSGIAIEGAAPFAPDRMPTVEWFDVDPHYFETLGVRLVKGRSLTSSDSAGANPVAIVNAAFARRFFPAGDAIGHRVTVQKHPAEIVGVVADVKPLQPDQATPPQIYWPIRQYPRGAAYLILKVPNGAAGIRKAMAERVSAVNPDIQLSALTTLDERLARKLVSPRFKMLLVASFAIVALLLAAVGVYGVMAFSVVSRTREFGVRVALGATPQQLVRSVVRGGMGLALIGVATGTAGALAISRLLANLLYGLSARDPLTLAGAVVILSGTALIASWVPARRASRVDPLTALRAQ